MSETKTTVIIKKLIEANAELDTLNDQYLTATLNLQHSQQVFDKVSGARNMKLTVIGILIAELRNEAMEAK